MKPRRIVFIYWDPHEAHLEWAKSITGEFYPFLPNRLRFTRFNIPLIHHGLSAFYSIKIPKADVYLIEGMGCILPVILKKRKDSKIIMINDDPFFYDYQFISKWTKWAYSKLLKKVDGIISTSRYMDSLIKDTRDIPREVVPLFVDVERYSKVNADLDSNDICFVSNQNYKKGTDILIKAFKDLRKELNGRLYLVGPFEDRFKGLKDENIITPGLVKKPEEYIKRCGMYINPARHEPFGINILEAMCAGMAPIVTNHCGTADLVKQVSKRLVINPDAADIAQTAKWLDINRRKKLSKLCKKQASIYTKEMSVAAFKNKFQEMIQ